MIQECVTITIQCDRAGCMNHAEATEKSHAECSKLLYTYGWRVSRDKHLCPEHAEQESRRLVRRVERWFLTVN